MNLFRNYAQLPQRAHVRRACAQRGCWFFLLVCISFVVSPNTAHAVVYVATCEDGDFGYDVAQYGGLVPTCGYVDPETGEIHSTLNAVELSTLGGDSSMWGGVTFADGWNLVFYGLLFIAWAMGFSKGGQR